MNRTVMLTILMVLSVLTAGTLSAHASTPRHITRDSRVHLPRTHLAHVVPDNSALISDNWSGYADVACKTCSIRYVTAHFNVPSVNCTESTGTNYYVSHWAGLDGLTSSTVEQAGVDAYCNQGTPEYFGWYEMYPQGPVGYSGINPGDAITVSVYYDAATADYDITFNDITARTWFTVTEACPAGSVCRNSSAEVITELPGGGVPAGYDLADFGRIGYTATAVTSRSGTHGNLTSNRLWTSYPIDIANGADTLAYPGPLQGGTAFDDYWLASS